jgi:uncharacterized protein
MTSGQAEKLVDTIRRWVEERDDLRALALVGSWARGNPKSSSDLDLIIVANSPEAYHVPSKWLRSIHFAKAAFEIRRYETCAYGSVWSCHIYSEPEAEVELTFAAPAWACIDPIDPGTRSVVADAFRAIVDKDGTLSRLLTAVHAHR